MRYKRSFYKVNINNNIRIEDIKIEVETSKLEVIDVVINKDITIVLKNN